MIRVGSLCTGYGGLEMAVGGTLTWVSDIDKGAATLLAHRYPTVRNLGDLTAVDWAEVEPVDVITAGFPCQPFSDAGRRKGSADERAIWPWIATAVRVVRPRAVVLENVVPVLRHEFGRVASDLAALGYDLAWTCVRASDVGAPHRRERLFVLAHTSGDGRPERRTEPAQWQRPGGQSPRHRRAATDTTDDRQQRGGSTWERWPGPADHGHAATDPLRLGRERSQSEPRRDHSRGNRRTDWGPYEPAIRRWEHALGRPAPAPTVDGRLNPAFCEWLMGLPDGWVTDAPGLSRTAKLKLLGNGVVPQQAIMALDHLAGAA